MALEVEDLARTALVRILPRSRYRLAAPTDARFQSFASNTKRIAYRQQGATPAFLLFSGPGQDPHSAATASATWAEANWRPNAVQRTVRPGVVVVQVAPRAELASAGQVPGTAVPAAVWTVDSETGRVEVAGNPPGSPPGGEVKRAAAALARGLPAPSLGELDFAERAVMQTRTIAMPRGLGGVAGVLLLLFALRYGFGALVGVLNLSSGLGAQGANQPLIFGGLVVNVLILAGIVLGVGVLFNIGNLAMRVPGFSSSVPRTRSLTWAGYVGVMIALAVVLDGVLPAAERSGIPSAAQGQYAHVTVTTNDDGSEVFVAVGGDLTVDLSGWPSSEWSGVQFKTSNPSILTLDASRSAGAPAVARFGAHQTGACRVDATSADGRYSFQIRVNVIS